jgi:hypothetical protein
VNQIDDDKTGEEEEKQVPPGDWECEMDSSPDHHTTADTRRKRRREIIAVGE